jgi:hypothetical protein
MRRVHAWNTHLYIVVIGVAIGLFAGGSAAAQGPARELLNSERIAAAFGNYAIEVLAQDGEIRVSNLFSTEGTAKICRTFAVVRFAAPMDPALGAEHGAILAGGSIGAVFAARGWEVRKTHLNYGVRPASMRLASLMRVDVGTLLAEHIYALDVVKDGRTIEYAALVEIHHPDYLGPDDLARIYGAVGEAQPELVARMRATAADRTR